MRASSPEGVPLVARGHSYDFVFVDGKHTNEQVVIDFEAVLPNLKSSSVVVFHDVGFHALSEGIAVLQRRYVEFDYVTYVGKRYRNLVGTGVFVRGVPEIGAFLRARAELLQNH